MVKLLNQPALQKQFEMQCAREKKERETEGEMGDDTQTFGTSQREAEDRMNEAVRKCSVVTQQPPGYRTVRE